MKFKLELHLIPESCFGSNLRKQLGNYQWDKLSKRIRTERNFTCDICDDTRIPKYMHLHEVWEFTNGIQKLVGFECVCSTCHDVHHWGLSQIQNKDMDDLMMHACEVNGCMEHDFQQHIRQSFNIWRQRSYQNWKLDLSYMDTMDLAGKPSTGLAIKMHRKRK